MVTTNSLHHHTSPREEFSLIDLPNLILTLFDLIDVLSIVMRFAVCDLASCLSAIYIYIFSFD